jgi:hypothetical protein
MRVRQNYRIKFFGRGIAVDTAKHTRAEVEHNSRAFAFDKVAARRSALSWIRSVFAYNRQFHKNFSVIFGVKVLKKLARYIIIVL